MLAHLVSLLVAAAPLQAASASEFSLSNGLRVRLTPVPNETEAVVLLGVRAGIFEERANETHLAHLVEHVTVFGAAPESEEEAAIARWYAQGRANAETLPDLMYFDLRVPPEEVRAAIRLQAGRLAASHVEEALLAREVPRALSEIEFLERQEAGGTAKFACSAFVQAALHGRREVPIVARSRALTVEDARAFHARTFRPERAILSIIGGFDVAAARKAVEESFGAIAAAKGPPAAPPAPKAGAADATWDVSTSHLLAGWLVPPASSPDHAALTAASIVLSQRLFSDPEIMAVAKLPIASNEVAGLFLVNVQARSPASLESLQKLVFERLARLSSPKGLADAEVRAACSQLASLGGPIDPASLPRAGQVPRALMLGNLELQRMRYALAFGDLAAYVKRLQSVDAASVRAAVSKHLDPKKAAVVRLKPASR